MTAAAAGLAFFAGLSWAAAPAKPPRLTITLEQAQRAALAHSPILKAAESDLAAAQEQADARFSQILPRVTLDGTWQYQTVVPTFAPAPGAPAVPFGSHRSYSAGPTFSYTLWDGGSLLNAWRSQRVMAGSREAQRELVRRQVLFLSRFDYFQVQLALEQERSQADSLRLAEAQYRDINSRFLAGSASRIDWLSAHEQVLGRRRDLRSAQADVASALRALFALMGQGQDADVSAPVDARIAQPPPSGLGAPTVQVELEPLESVEAKLEPAASASLDEGYPQVLVYSRQAESLRMSAKSVSAGEWPRVQAFFRSDYLYPNLPLLESAWQNVGGASVSVPFLEFGRTRREARAQRDLADAAARQRDEALDELDRDWHKARDQYAALRWQEALDRESVEETAEIARLRYSSYRNGGSTILDVETANLDAVEARVTAARRRTQVLIQLATLDSLSAVKENP